MTVALAETLMAAQETEDPAKPFLSHRNWEIINIVLSP